MRVIPVLLPIGGKGRNELLVASRVRCDPLEWGIGKRETILGGRCFEARKNSLEELCVAVVAAAVKGVVKVGVVEQLGGPIPS